MVDRLRGADAILLSPGMVAHVSSVFERRGAPAMILRLNWARIRHPVELHREPKRAHDLATQAVSLGADIVLVGMSIKTGSEAVDAENVAQVARSVAEKRDAGVPIIGEVYPAGHEDIAPEERHDQILIGCRIAAELGADLVKTFHTGARFAEIVQSTPVPILRWEPARPPGRSMPSSSRRRPSAMALEVWSSAAMSLARAARSASSKPSRRS